MEPWEIMISESQERMVAVVRPQMLDAVRGGVRALGAAVHADRRGDRARRAARVLRRRGRRRDPGAAPDRRVPALRGRAGEARRRGRVRARARAPANRADKTWIIEQYDQLVGSRTVRRPGLDAAVLRLRPSLRGLAVALAGAARPARRDPFRAGVQAVLGAARNVACAGGEPIGLTDCLNFGNPEKPEIAHELAQAIEGIAQAAEALGDPGRLRATSRSTTTPTAARSRRRRSSAASGSSPTCALVPGRWRAGDVVLLARRPRRASRPRPR